MISLVSVLSSLYEVKDLICSDMKFYNLKKKFFDSFVIETSNSKLNFTENLQWIHNLVSLFQLMFLIEVHDILDTVFNNFQLSK